MGWEVLSFELIPPHRGWVNLIRLTSRSVIISRFCPHVNKEFKSKLQLPFTEKWFISWHSNSFHSAKHMKFPFWIGIYIIRKWYTIYITSAWSHKGLMKSKMLVLNMVCTSYSSLTILFTFHNKTWNTGIYEFISFWGFKYFSELWQVKYQ